MTKAYFLLTLAMLLFHDDAMALRCGQKIVEPGDTVTRVARYCPEPFWVDRYSASHYDNPVYGYANEIVGQREDWYLNLGSRKLMRRLTFFNGRLEKEETLDYGFPSIPHSSNCSGHDLANAGDTLAEIYASCGAPDFKFSYPVVGYPYHHGRGSGRSGPAVTFLHHVWTYVPKRGRERIMHFESGQLISVEQGD